MGRICRSSCFEPGALSHATETTLIIGIHYCYGEDNMTGLGWYGMDEETRGGGGGYKWL